MLIRITGPAEVTLDDGGRVTGSSTISELDGAESEDLCNNYLGSELADLGITGGTVRLTYDAGEGRFRVTTEYISPVELGAEQLERLGQETAGQWSDGIGEGCFDELAGRLGVSIRLPPPERGRRLRVEQIEDGKTTGRTG